MRLNVFIAQATGLSRRAADTAIEEGRVAINGKVATLGQQATDTDRVSLDNRAITPSVKPLTLMLNKPVGFVCSRDGQGSKTVYDLLPKELHQVKPVGRLDKDSSGLLLMTNDGKLANELTHPRYGKTKIYEIILHKPLTPHDKSTIEKGVMLDDGISHLNLTGEGSNWVVTMQEGRNRQIRRTFTAMNYSVRKLHRVQFGSYSLKMLGQGLYLIISPK